MSDHPHWPAYETGRHDSVFALGVASIKYSELEFTLARLMSKATGMPLKTVVLLFQSLSNDGRIKLLNRCIDESPWPEEVRGLFTHFVNGFNICAENRNSLMHSGMRQALGDQNLLYKTSKRGNGISVWVTLQELRDVADNMDAYVKFGTEIDHSLSQNWSTPSPTPSSLDRPALPNLLQFEPR